MFSLFEGLLLIFVVFLAEVFLFERWEFILFLFAIADVFFSRIVSDELVAVVFSAFELEVFVAFFIDVLFVEFVVVLLVIEALVLAVVILDFDLNLVS